MLLVLSILIATISQARYRHWFYKNLPYSRTPALKKRPQVKGVVNRVRTMSPKKPNSATRHVAKIRLTYNWKATCRLQGSGYLCSKFNRVLMTGGRANDLPGVGYTVIRGVYDLSPIPFKKKRRSVYGTSRPQGYTTYMKKSQRGIYQK